MDTKAEFDKELARNIELINEIVKVTNDGNNEVSFDNSQLNLNHGDA